MNYGMRFMTLYGRQGPRPSPWKRNAKRQNGGLGRALQIAVKRREAKSKGEKERYKLNNNINLNPKSQVLIKLSESCIMRADLQVERKELNWARCERRRFHRKAIRDLFSR